MSTGLTAARSDVSLLTDVVGDESACIHCRDDVALGKQYLVPKPAWMQPVGFDHPGWSRHSMESGEIEISVPRISRDTRCKLRAEVGWQSGRCRFQGRK